MKKPSITLSELTEKMATANNPDDILEATNIFDEEVELFCEDVSGARDEYYKALERCRLLLIEKCLTEI